MAATTLIVPGLGNSGPGHWQSWWLAQEPAAIRVIQDDWELPDLPRWADRVTAALDASTGPVWIVAHSFGCLAAVMAANQKPDTVAGLFLVAPADPHHFSVNRFLPQSSLLIPSILVASSNDPWLKLMTAAVLAQRWGSKLINIGAAGHVNADSGFGPWVKGRVLFREFSRSQEGWLHGAIGGDIVD